MQDAIVTKQLLTATYGNPVTLERVFNDAATGNTRSANVGAESPLKMRISHTPQRSENDARRSSISMNHSMARLDENSNIARREASNISLNRVSHPGQTEAEFISDLQYLFGLLTENNFDIARRWFRGEG